MISDLVVGGFSALVGLIVVVAPLDWRRLTSLRSLGSDRRLRSLLLRQCFRSLVPVMAWSVVAGAAAALATQSPLLALFLGLCLGTWTQRSRPLTLGGAVGGSDGEEIQVTAVIPDAVKPEARFVLRYFACGVGDSALIASQLDSEDPGSSVRRCPVSPRNPEGRLSRWPANVMVDVMVRGHGVMVTPDCQRFEWLGTMVNLVFDAELVKGACQPLIYIDTVLEGVIVARQRLGVRIDAVRNVNFSPHVVKVARRLFASYSSSDRNRVLERVMSIKNITGAEVFVDCLSIGPSKKWRSVIRDAIDQCDGFLLFWSVAASRSKEVELEWRRARDLGKPIQVHPLEPAEPPTELRDLHFWDPMFYAVQAGSRHGSAR